MVLEREKLIQEIRSGLAYLQQYVSYGGKENLTDTNIYAEDFVSGLLNILYGWNLVNANRDVANFPCIDLIDTTLGIGIQVTSERNSKKINKTIVCLKKHSLSNKINSLRIFTLKKKQKNYTISVNCPEIEFNWRNHIIDFEDIFIESHKIQDIARLDMLHEYVVYSIPIFQKNSKKELPLYIPSTAKESSSLAFSSQTIRLVGREKELEQLSSFLDSDQNYLWWLITGSAGSGKSRIALELCEQYKNNGWEVGFLSRTESDFAWSSFRPEKNTLIVVDYVSNRTETVSNAILELSRRSLDFDKVVRVLLLERNKGSWWGTLSKEESLSEESEILTKQYDDTPLVLAGLSEQSLLEIAKEFTIINKGVWSTKIAETLLNWMSKHHINNLPLYALIFLEFPNTEEPDELLRKVLKKEAGLRYSQINNPVVSKQIDNLLFLTTLTGGLLPKSYSFRFLINSDIEDLVPNISTMDNDLYSNITGSPKDIKYLSGLQPDLLGERYVLDCLSEKGLNGVKFQRLLLAAYEFQPNGVLAFSTKSFFDFPDDESIPQLFDLPNDTAAFRALKARLVSQVMIGFRSIFNDFLQQQLKEIISVADMYPNENELQKYVALAEYHLGCSIAFPGKIPFPFSFIFSRVDKKAEAMKRFDAVLSRVSYDSQVGTMALLNRGTFECDTEKAISMFTKVINSQHSANETRACALNNRANEYFDKGDHTLAISDRNDVLLLTGTSPDRRFVALFRRGESFSAIGKHDLVVDDMTKIIEMNDVSKNDKQNASLIRAVSYHFMGEHSKSNAYLEEVLDSLLPKITNLDTQALAKNAERSRRTGFWDQANDYLQKANERDDGEIDIEGDISLKISYALLLHETKRSSKANKNAWDSLKDTICSNTNKIRIGKPGPI